MLTTTGRPTPSNRSWRWPQTAACLPRSTRCCQTRTSTVHRRRSAEYEHPDRVTDDSIDIYLRPLVRTEQRTRDFQRFLAAFDNKHTMAIEARLEALKAPTMIVWGTDDVYFDVKWSRWLAETIPGTRRRLEFEGARIFFPEERWAEFNQELRAHWQAAAVDRGN